jgi:PAS domain S-box-containing protein
MNDPFSLHKKARSRKNDIYNRNYRHTVARHLALEQSLQERTAELEQVKIRLEEELEDRGRAEQFARKNEERLRLVLDHSLDVVYRRNLQVDRYDYISPVVEQILGFTVEEMNRMNIDEVFNRIHPDDIGLVTAALELSVDSGEGRLEYRFLTRSSQYRWIADHVTVQKDLEGQPLYRTGILRDITDQKLAETRLAYQAMMLDNVSDAIVATDPQFRITTWNSGAQQMYGWTAQEALGKPINDIVWTNFTLEEFHRFVELANPDGSVIAEAVQVSRNGNQRYIEGKLLTIRDLQGRITAYLSVIHDISDRKLAEMEIQESEHRFRIALENAPISVFTQDLQLRYTWVYNPLSHFSPEQVLGKRDDELETPENVAELIAVKKGVIKTGQGVRKEISVILGGEPYTILLTLEPLRDNSGKIIGLRGAGIDHTEQHRREVEKLERATQLEVRRRLSEHRELERQEIARNLHDGPLQDLISLIFNIQTAMKLDDLEKVQELLQSIRTGAQDLANDLRTVCNELRPPILMQFGLSKAIHSHAIEFREQHPEIRLRVDAEGHSRSIPNDISLALYRVYRECLNNIVRHSNATEAIIHLVTADHSITLEVSDNGSGFMVPADWVEMTREGHLGMAGMIERMEAIGGKLELSSKSGIGTVISATAPLHTTSAARSAVHTPPKQAVDLRK